MGGDEQKVEQKIAQVGQVLNEVQTISETYKKVAEATGENFNIFSVLQIESDEISTHSRFIAALLDPKGQHGLKDAFLKLFVECFVPKLELNTENSNVYTEYYIGEIKGESGGRIDILIDDGDNVIMIENKIYASEQPNQLSRYHNFGEKKEKKKSELLYLTLYGEDSENHKSFSDYKPISYEKDIINWLEECKKEAINIPTLRETISQYINLLKKLTNQNLSKKMNEDIIARVIKDKNSLSAYKAIQSIDPNSVKKELVKGIIGKIKEIFNKEDEISFDEGNMFLIFQTEKLKLSFEEKNYSKLIIGFINSDEQIQNPNLWDSRIEYEGYKNIDLEALNKIYFEESTFYTELKKEIDRLIEEKNKEVS